MDINTKILKKNAFRVTKERGMTASRIRVPGGHLDAKYLSQIQHIAETFGNGTVHEILLSSCSEAFLLCLRLSMIFHVMPVFL